MKETLKDLMEFAVETAYLAGRVTLGYFQSGVRPDYKEDDTPVTIADRMSEELIRKRIENVYPNHAIVGEEYGITGKDRASHRWIIDPIDGTKSFVRGVPLYAVLLGLEIEGNIEVGVVNIPAMGEIYAAASGQGSWWNGRRIHVSSVSTLDKAYFYYDAAHCTLTQKGNAVEKIKNKTYHSCGWGGDAYAFLLVASGRAEVMLDSHLQLWDYAPYPPILREAGGYFGDWSGNTQITGEEVVATSQQLLPEVLALLNELRGGSEK